MKHSEEYIRSAAEKVFAHSLSAADELSLESIAPDGSTRSFYRVKNGDTTLCLAILPAGESARDMAEQRSVQQLGHHLRGHSVGVPEIYGADETVGLVFMEDLGDNRLYDHIYGVEAGDERSSRIEECYGRVVDGLAHMQFSGAQNLETTMCYDSFRYDEEIMIRTESCYFERAFFNNYLGCESPGGILGEFEELARLAASGNNSCFLHRDVQSRNIMLHNDEIYFIDFQAGRLGPPGYDLASLLLDPYVGLSHSQQTAYYEEYKRSASRFETFDADQFDQLYPYLAAQRNLQIIGAFSFLYKEKKKEFFKEYIPPSVVSLHRLLQQSCFQSFPILRKTAEKSLNLLQLKQEKE